MRQALRYKPLWLLLLVLVVLRIPTFNRPLSKHHDFNNAVILINAISWQQAGGGAQFCFTPLMNFQGAANKMLEHGWHIDKLGNHVYLSFGPGWYLIPYTIFHLLHLSPSPPALESVNILIGLITTLLLFAFLTKLTGRQDTSLAAAAIVVLAPAPLWYMGHSYVTTAIMQPLVIWLLWQWHIIAVRKKQTITINLLQLLLAGLLLIYIDWISVFLLAGFAAWSLFSKQTLQQKATMILTSAATALLGIFLVLAQFACYLGWEQVLGYWVARFAERGTMEGMRGGLGIPKQLLSILLPAAAPILLTGLLLLWKSAKSLKHLPSWVYFAFAATLVYNIIFLEWSMKHEFAWMTMMILSAIPLAISLSHVESSRTFRNIYYSIIALGIVQYFVINPPGKQSLRGALYAAKQKLAQKITEQIDSEAVIFTNLPNAKIEEYYSVRTFNSATSYAKAKQIADSLQLPNAVWLLVQNDEVVFITPIRTNKKSGQLLNN